jgi:hypothetical protein
MGKRLAILIAVVAPASLAFAKTGLAVSPHQSFQDETVMFGLALTAAVCLARRGAPWWWTALCLGWPAFQGYEWSRALRAAWPPQSPDVSLLRAVVAAAAAAVLVRERLAPARFPANRGIALGALGVCGVLGFAAFYNLGAPQFRNHAENRRTFVHYLDHRQYFTTAKYFSEIGYRGLYRADLAAYLEDEPARREAVARKPMRDLDTHRMSTVGAQTAAIEAVKELFSPGRWEAYKRDARYFRRAMGEEEYFRYMADFGGNATPVWMAIAGGLYNRIDPGEKTLFLTGLLDAVLILLAFAAIGRCFGLRTMLVCMTVFGANDFIMFGSNWGGATLRHDWMAYLALGVCALKRERWVLGGAFLGFATMIRAFPALAIAGPALPALWWIYEYRASHGRFPSVAEFRGAHRGLERTLLGAVCAMIALGLGASLMFSFGAWADWWEKVALLSSEPHGNHISLRSLIGGWGDDQARVLRARMPVFLAALAACLGAVLAAARGKRPEQAAILGLVLVPILFYPANYYLHLVFLLPLLMTEEKSGAPLDEASLWVALSVLLLCVAQYFTIPVTPWGAHFYQATVLLFVALAALIGGIVRADARNGLWRGGRA